MSDEIVKTQPEKEISTELSVEDENFREMMLEIVEKIRSSGDEKNAEYLRAGLEHAGKKLWSKMKAGDSSASLRDLWLSYYEQQEPFFARELVLGLVQAIEVSGSLKEETIRDGLTGLFNKRKFILDIERSVKKYQTDKQEFCLVIIDLDEFKRMNDRYGHFEGDRYLKYLAEALEGSIRSIEGDAAYRFGGDEFSLLLPVDLETAKDVMERVFIKIKELNEKRREKRDTQTLRFDISISAGIASASQIEGELSVEKLIKAADKTLYQVKGKGGEYLVYKQDEN